MPEEICYLLSYRKVWVIGWLDQEVTSDRGVTSMSGIWPERLQ